MLTCKWIKPNNWELLGEKTLQAVNQAQRHTGTRGRRLSGSAANTPFDLDSQMEDSGSVAWTNDQSSVSGQQQANPQQQQSLQQQQRQDVEQQSSGNHQPVPEGVRQELEDIKNQLRELREAISGRRQDGERSIIIHFP
ncbi:hypothetical protein ACHAQJ_006378 [Trichoderma viride]